MPWGYRPPTAGGVTPPTSQTPTPTAPTPTATTPTAPVPPAETDAVSQSGVARSRASRAGRPPLLIVGTVLLLPILGVIVATRVTTDRVEFPTISSFAFETQTAPTTPEPTFARPHQPLAIGDAWNLGPFTVRLTRVDLNADATILAVNQFNEPAPAGSQFVLVDITFSNTSTEEAWVTSELWFELRDSLGKTHDSFGGRVLPSPLPIIDAVPPNSSVSGQLAFIVSSDAIEGATIEVNAWDEFSESAVQWTLEP